MNARIDLNRFHGLSTNKIAAMKIFVVPGEQIKI